MPAMHIAKQILALGRRLPIHPQWLLGSRKPLPAIGKLHGMVLDIGCADRWIEPLLLTGTMYIGLDYPPTGSALYAARADVLADAAALPLADSTVDSVVCLEVLEHTRNYQSALHEIHRVLKPDGTLILSMPFIYPIHDAPHDYQRLTEHGLRRDMAVAGFEVLRLNRRGDAIRTSGLLFNLALAGGLYTRKSVIDYLLFPFVALLVLTVNLSALALSWILPDWNAMCFGYEIEAVKTGMEINSIFSARQSGTT